MTAQRETPSAGTVDSAEIAHFSGLAARWWDPGGPMAGLHRMNPVRVGYLRDAVAQALDRPRDRALILEGLDVLDVGCGGGILSEPLARLGGRVTGLDASAEAIAAAAAHAAEGGLDIAYEVGDAEALAARGARFDVVAAMEIVEHVADLDLFVGALVRLVRPGGVLVLSTINRTAKAFGLAIVAGEYLLNWVPRGTHHYGRLVRPSELAAALRRHGMALTDLRGMVFDARAGWRLDTDVSVNYLATAR